MQLIGPCRDIPGEWGEGAASGTQSSHLDIFIRLGSFPLCQLSVERRPSGGCSRPRASCSPSLGLCLGALDFSALGHEADLV